MRFTKMHGIGNDYVYFDCTKEDLPDPEKWAVKLSDRHKGVGGDGIILIQKSDKADFKMRMFNADGSEGKMCGNGTRCIAKYVFDRGLTDKTELTLETLGGIKHITVFPGLSGKAETIRVDMGAPVLDPPSIPVKSKKYPVIDEELTVDGVVYRATCVSMGNPHAVIFVEDHAAFPVERVGKAIENMPSFPEKVNVEFVRVDSPRELTMRVWERGSGETLACGTGACAAVVASCLKGFCPRNEEVTVHLSGGDLHILYRDTVLMRGGATFVFDGELIED
ncbi:MAG: diaminopimelate epimerase [Clostridia bacterium]|nr:diaminopimelate epimerase [Clostridia bacterium]